MPRNPIARALPVHRHQVIPDKRVSRAMQDLKDLWNQSLEEDIPEEWLTLLNRLK